MTDSKKSCRYELVSGQEQQLHFHFIGDWTLGHHFPIPNTIAEQFENYPDFRVVVLNATQLGNWDSCLVAFIVRLLKMLEQYRVQLDQSGLPEGVRRLVHLASVVPEKEDARKEFIRESILTKIGKHSLSVEQEIINVITFVGEAGLSIIRFFRGNARFRAKDFWLIVEECGPNALPIVTLISVLIGLILAFVGAVQLSVFGADIYIANLVALGMVREMGAMMTAIIMAGRTGAAYAAQLGTMQVNEEIDAFKTMGFVPMDFLVLPRMLALILMMPLLTLYADFLGMVGGMLVGVGMLDLSLTEYYTQTVGSITLMDCATGLIKSAIFGVLVALSGCMRGMQCGRSSSAVGYAATSAVVSGIVCIVVADSILTVIYNSLNI